jgi:hypothetical protein
LLAKTGQLDRVGLAGFARRIARPSG